MFAFRAVRLGLMAVFVFTACSQRESARPTPQITAPSLELRCPSRALFPLADLNIPKSSRLFAVPADDETETHWVLISSSGKPEPYPYNLDNVTRVRSGFAGINPKKDGFAFYAISSDGPKPGLGLWIGSINGEKPRQVIQGLQNPSSLEWANDDTIVLFDQQAGDPWRMTSKKLDVNSNLLETIEPIYLDSGTYAFSPNGFQVIHAAGFPLVWRLFDFRLNQQYDVLPWLKAESAPGANRAFMHWTESGVSVALLTPTMVKLVNNLAPEALTQDNPISQVIPFAGASTNHSIMWWSANSQLIGLRRSFGERKGIPAIPQEFYIIDAATLHITEYCLPDEAIPDTVFASADSAFLAWNAIRENTKGIMILDIATGRTAFIPDFRMLGWGSL